MRLNRLLFLISAPLLAAWPVVIDCGSEADSNFFGGATTIIASPTIPPDVTDLTSRYGTFRYEIPADHTATHSHLAASPTTCPGRMFPAQAILGTKGLAPFGF